MRPVPKEAIDIIKHFEGLRLAAYLCPGGYRTIGYGHKMDDHEKMIMIGEQEAHNLLLQDLAYAVHGVMQFIRVPLTDGQFGALVSFTYNLGAGSLKVSTLRKRVNDNEHEQAASEFAKWKFAGGRILNGLIRRRAAEANLYSSNVGA